MCDPVGGLRNNTTTTTTLSYHTMGIDAYIDLASVYIFLKLTSDITVIRNLIMRLKSCFSDMKNISCTCIEEKHIIRKQ